MDIDIRESTDIPFQIASNCNTSRSNTSKSLKKSYYCIFIDLQTNFYSEVNE